MGRVLLFSVVVPTRNSARTLETSLSAIRESSLQPGSYEIVVVDDVSTDNSVSIAARYADTIVRLKGPQRGLAYARNRGAEVARAEIVAFIDPDVAVEVDTLRDMLMLLHQRPDLDAVSAARHESSAADNFASQYWNLLLCYGDARYHAGSSYFSAACGMIRRSALISVGMYDEWRRFRSGVESLELTGRLRAAGRRVILGPEIRVRHLRSWTMRSVCGEAYDRSLLLARSLGYERIRSSVPSEIVFTLTRALAPAFAVIAVVTLTASFLPRPYTLAKLTLGVVAVLATNTRLHGFFAKARGVVFAALAAPVHLCIQAVSAVGLCVGWVLRDAFGDALPDATTQAYSEVGVEIWPPVPRRI